MADKIAEHMALALRWFTTGLATDHAALEASARALAQGEPGEAFGTYVEYSDGTTAFRKRGEPFAPTVLGGTVWTLYLSPTASAPAAEREPRSTFRKCEHCGCETNAKMRACCRAGWVDDKVASETRIAGIGTKEPTNG